MEVKKAMECKKKLRILCLHGYHQNKDIFRQKTGSFRKPLKKYADFEFLDAPHLINENSNEQSVDHAFTPVSSDFSPDGRGWWLNNAPDSKSDGLDVSLSLFELTLKEKGPFDGVMGFSQGASFLALACIILGENLFPRLIKFSILIAGFKSKIPAHGNFYLNKTKIDIPTLHVIGETDAIVSTDRSKQLFEMFNNGQLVYHPGGHYVAVTKDLKVVYQTFIEQFYEK